MDNLRCVLCPVDFSEATAFGINVGESLARRFRVPLTLLHVLPHLPLPLRLPMDLGPLYEQWDTEAKERLEALAADVRKRGVATTTEITRGGPIHQIIVMEEDRDCDLIVMPTHGRAGLDRLLHGSIAEGVVRVARGPVLTVPPTLEGLEPFDPQRILVATDFSDAAERAFAAAVQLAERYASDLVVAHVFTFQQIGEHGSEWFLPTFTKEQVEQAIGEVTRRLEKLAQRAQQLGVAASTDVSQGSSPAREIARLASEEEVDLVVVASHGEGLLKRALLGSTTSKLVRFCPRPLLMIPGGTDEPFPECLEALAPAGC